LAADFDEDGIVGLDDLTILARYFDEPGGPNVCATGDTIKAG
jgi:hypothetical protein